MTRSPGFALAAVLAALTAACGGAPRAPTAPAPQPQPAGAEQIGQAPDLPAAPAASASASILGTASYDLPVVANPWVETELSFLVNQRREVIGRWLERADFYDAWVQEVFAGYGIPRDLHHLAMVESGYLPTARSHAGAVGMWQFMSGTGRGMGLRIDELVDERMDPVRSTHAAARHLKQLHQEFRGDWALAAAAYNAGSGRINRGLGRFGVTSYWDLVTVGDLATETKHYVPRLFAVTIIAKDRGRFGYGPPSGPVRRFAYDSVEVDVPVPLTELARIANLPADELRALNPHLVRGMVPARYWVWTPDGTGTATQVAFQNSEFRRDGGYGTYAVRRGDDLGKLAELTGVPVERIRELNPGADPANLRSGQRLNLPAAAARLLAARPAERVAARGEEGASSRASSSSRSRNADGEGRGDRSASSTRARNSDGGDRSESSSSSSSSRSSSRSRNSDGEERTEGSSSRSSSSARSRNSDGEGRGESRSASTRTRSSDGEERASGSSRTSSSSSRSSSGERTALSSSTRASGHEHTVGDGETLWAIARRYDVTVDAVKEANDLGSAPIQPGQKLRIPRAASASSASAPSTSSASSSSRAASSERSASSERASSAERSASRERSASGERRGGGETRSSSSSTSSSSARTASSERAGRTEHVVKSGETLWSIARRYSSTVEAIRDANDLGAQAAIQPGQTLRIPAAASSGGSRD